MPNADKLDQLHDRLLAQTEALTQSQGWQDFLAMAARFHRYSANNVMLILAQAPHATQVAGYRRWQSLGRQVRKGERGIAILAPCVKRRRPVDDEEETDQPELVRILRGFTVAHVWDVSQTDGEPLPDVRPALLAGEAPAGLWGALAQEVRTAGFELARGDCGGANGRTDYLKRTVRVRDDVDDAQAVKTLAHDPLTAPARRPCTRRTKDLAHPRLWALTVVDCVPTNRGGRIMEGRDVTALVAVRTGRLETTASGTGVRLLDGDGMEVAAVSEFLKSLLASGASLSSLRSYAMDLLRWWRFLDAVGVAWDRAGRVETRDFVLWMRSGSKRPPDGGSPRSPFAPATINHNLAVLRRFYNDRMAAGTGPLINPVPDALGRNRDDPTRITTPCRFSSVIGGHRFARGRRHASPRASRITASTNCSRP